MKRILVKFFASYLALVLAFVVLKPAFMLAHHSLYVSAPARSLVAAMWHGLSMDLSMGAYFMVVPAILILVSCFVGAGRVMRRIECGYYIFAALVISLIAILDTALYSYWEFRLDTTPFEYFFSAPAMAMASVTTLQAIGGIIGWLAVAALFYALFYYVAVRKPMPSSARVGRYGRAALSAFLMVALFLPMRGSVTVSTMNLSRANFSSDMRLNHAAINPAFSLMYSLTHSDDFASKFRFFSEDEARKLSASMIGPFAPSDSTEHLLSVERPDVYVVVLESFSSHLLPCMGGEPIAMRLDSIARSGLLFDNIYASSFRTDRALVAVLSGLHARTIMAATPTSPTNLPSCARAASTKSYTTRISPWPTAFPSGARRTMQCSPAPSPTRAAAEKVLIIASCRRRAATSPSRFHTTIPASPRVPSALSLTPTAAWVHTSTVCARFPRGTARLLSSYPTITEPTLRALLSP